MFVLLENLNYEVPFVWCSRLPLALDLRKVAVCCFEGNSLEYRNQNQQYTDGRWADRDSSNMFSSVVVGNSKFGEHDTNYPQSTQEEDFRFNNLQDLFQS